MREAFAGGALLSLKVLVESPILLAGRLSHAMNLTSNHYLLFCLFLWWSTHGIQIHIKQQIHNATKHYRISALGLVERNS